MRIVFMGTPDFAVPSLQHIVQSKHELVGVISRPDKPQGRGQKMQPPPVKAAAEALGLTVPILQPESLHDPNFHAQLKSLQPDLFAVVAFLILPRSVLAIPACGSVNVHPSLLPKYRGAAPIQWAIINGETETGISIFKLSARIDAGDLLLQEKVVIYPDETAGELYERLKIGGAHLLVKTLDGIMNNTLISIPQSSKGVTRAPKLEKEDGHITWMHPANAIRNRIRGVTPFPGAFAHWRGQILKIHQTTLSVEQGNPGNILQADPKWGVTVATGQGALILNTVQPQGKKPMSGAEWVRGYQVVAGEILG
jgi:methionyl-tRNA formyltransferase